MISVFITPPPKTVYSVDINVTPPIICCRLHRSIEHTCSISTGV